MSGRLTNEELAALPLHKRVRYVRELLGTTTSPLSHDKLATRMGGPPLNRQRIISWEKAPGTARSSTPSPEYAQKLAEVSGYPAGLFRPPDALSRRELEERVEALEALLEQAAQAAGDFAEQVDELAQRQDRTEAQLSRLAAAVKRLRSGLDDQQQHGVSGGES